MGVRDKNRYISTPSSSVFSDSLQVLVDGARIGCQGVRVWELDDGVTGDAHAFTLGKQAGVGDG